MEIDARDKWKLDKWSMFSASEIVKLLVEGPVIDKKTGETEMFGEGALTYIERVARESYTMFNEDENPTSYAMKMGSEREPEGAGYYMRYLGLTDMIYYGVGNSRFFKFNEHAGASPDCVLWLDEKNQIASVGAEGKNPSPATHDWYLTNIITQNDLRREEPGYFAQIQFTMLALNCDLWHWYSHCSFFKEKERLLLIQVEADKNFQNKIRMRLKAAIKLKMELIKARNERLKRLV